MDIELAKFFVKVSEEMGNQECKLQEDYSGRGMYGHTTAAVVCNNPLAMMMDALQYIKDCMDNSDAELDDIWEKLPDFRNTMLRTDNMGRDSMIVY